MMFIKLKRVILFLFLFLFIVFSQLVHSYESVPGELIVKFKNSNAKSIAKVVNSLGLKIDREINLSYGTLHVVTFPKNKSLKLMADVLTNASEIEYAEPNYIYSIIKPIEEVTFESIMDFNYGEDHYTPTDPKFTKLWGLHNTGSNKAKGVAGADIDALKAWDITTGDRNVKIAVIDTGIDYTHPDLKNNIWVNEAEKNGKPNVDDDKNGYVDDIHGYDFANNDGDPMDGHSHGTHCSGTIGAVHNNGIGVAGVMDNVTLVGVKFLTDSGSGSTENAIKAVDYATKLNVDIMSNSWGGGGHSQALKEAIIRAKNAGIIFVAAAGNSASNNDQTPHYPSNYDVENVVSVAAHNSSDILASFSCYGRNTVHLAAPGRSILSTVKGGGYKSYSGTSMATPHVSGALGLLVSHVGRLPHEEMRTRLMATSFPVRSYRRKVKMGGRLNAFNLLTDFRPPRDEPNPEDWETVALDKVFESDHPYANNTTLEKSIKIDGVKYIRVMIEKYETENKYDYLLITTPAGLEVEKISGSGVNYATDYAEGDSIKIKFKSDYSVTKWGFVIKEVQVIRK